jgi:hypothetical protein
MKQMRRITLWVLAGLSILLIGISTWLWTADLGVFKPQIERLIREQTERSFTIANLQIDLDAESSVIAEQVRFGNAGWAGDRDMIEIDRLEVRVDLWSLLRGPVIVQRIDLDGARVLLQRPEDGPPNWAFSELPPDTQAEELVDETPFQVLFSEITVDDAHISFESPERTGPIDLRINSFTQRHRADDFLDLDFDGQIGDRSVSFEGEIGTWDALLGGEDIRYAVEGELDAFTFGSTGHIDSVLSPSRPSLAFSASGPDINELFAIAEIDATGEGDIQLSGSLHASDTDPLVLNIEGNVGRLEIEASGEFSDLQNLEDVDLELQASGPALGRILRLFDIHQIDDAPFMINVDAERRGSRMVIERAHMLLADAEFDATAEIPNFPSPDDANIQLRIAGPDIVHFRDVMNLPGMASGAFSIVANLSTLEVAALDLDLPLGRLNARGTLTDDPELVGTALEITLEGKSLALLARNFGLPRMPDVPFVGGGSATLTDEGIQTRGPLVFEVNGITVSVDGLIGNTRGLYGSHLAYTLEGPDLSGLITAFVDTPYMPARPYDLHGVLDVREDGFRFGDLSGQVGSASITLDGLLVPVTGMYGSRFDFALNGPEVGELLTDAVNVEVRPGAFALGGSVGFREEAIDLANITLERELGTVELDLELGLTEPARIRFSVDADGRDIRDVLSRFEGIEADEAPFSVNAEGEWQASRLSLDGLDIEIGDAVIGANGDLDLAPDAQSTRFRFNASTPSLARLGTFQGYRLRDQAFSVDADVRGGGGVLAIDDLKASLDDSDIIGFVRIEAGDVPFIDIELRSESLLLESPVEQQEATYDPEPTFDDGRLIPNTQLPLEPLSAVNATVAVSIGNLISDERNFRDFDVEINLNDGILDISKFGFRAPLGRLDARARITPTEDSAEIGLEVSAKGLALGLAQSNRNLKMSGDIEINLHATGTNLRSLAASANGIVLFDTRGGRFANNRALQALYGDMLQEILSVINPFYTADPITTFECIVLPLEFNDGQLTSVPNAFIRTDKIRIVSGMDIDLKTEALDMGFRTTPRRGIVISAGEILNPFVKVVGTLAAPRLAVDEQGVLVSGGTAVATGGLSILARAAWERLNRSKDPCNDTTEKAREVLGDRFADFMVHAAN